jgi:hypothetical protein
VSAGARARSSTPPSWMVSATCRRYTVKAGKSLVASWPTTSGTYDLTVQGNDTAVDCARRCSCAYSPDHKDTQQHATRHSGC